MAGIWVGLQRSLATQDPTGDVVVEACPTRIQTLPQLHRISPVLTKQRLQLHGLMPSLDLGVLGRAPNAREPYIHTEREQPQMEPGRER